MLGTSEKATLGLHKNYLMLTLMICAPLTT